MSKATKQEILEREQAILQLIGEGKDKGQILSSLSVRFKVAEKTIQNTYYQVLNDMKAIAMDNKEELRAELLIQQKAIQQRAWDSGALKVALDASTARGKLAGLNEKAESQAERPSMITVSEKDMSGVLEVVPTGKVENE